MQEIGQITAKLLTETERRMAERAGRIPARIQSGVICPGRDGSERVEPGSPADHTGLPLANRRTTKDRADAPSGFMNGGNGAAEGGERGANVLRFPLERVVRWPRERK